MIIQGDCLEVMKTYSDNHFSGIVTDPPYGLSFMGKDWDHSVPGVAFWKEALRVCKPGSMMLCFGGTRTYHRLTCAIEDAGWEIRDCLMWLYGSGFPKSLDISKSIDKQRNDYLLHVTQWVNKKIKESGKTYKEILEHFSFSEDSGQIRHWAALTINSQPSIPNNEQWEKLKCFLSFSIEMDEEVKRLNERKHVFGENFKNRQVIGKGHSGSTAIWNSKGGMGNFDITDPSSSLAKQFSGYGTALKPAWEPIILAMKPCDGTFAQNADKWGQAGLSIDVCRIETNENISNHSRSKESSKSKGIYGDSCYQETHQTEAQKLGRWPANLILDKEAGRMLDEQSGASRFFYCAKSSSSERGEFNNHPCVKPLKLIIYLLKLISPPKDALILDPFAGSGTTCVSAKQLDLDCVGIELNPEYCEIAKKRLDAVKVDNQLKMF